MQVRLNVSRNAARCALIVLIASVLAPSMAKPPAPAPPPTPPALTLSPYLNVVLGAGTSLRLFTETRDPSKEFLSEEKWTESAYGGTAIQLATIATGPVKGIVVGKYCSIGTKRAPQYGHYLNVFRDGSAGLWKTNYYNQSEYIIDTTPGAQIIAVNLDGVGVDEIVMITAHKVGVYYSDPTYGYDLRHTIDLDALGSTAAGQGLTWNWRDFAVGDVRGGDGSPEVVIAGSYRDAAQKDHAHLFVLGADLDLGSITSYDLSSGGNEFNGIGDFSIADVKIGDHDGDGQKEIWVSGWVNHFEMTPATYDNLVYAWTIDAGSLNDFKQIDADGPGVVSKTIGPYITLGDLNPQDGKDELIVHRRDPSSADASPHHIDVYTATSITQSITYPDRRATDIQVVNGYMFVMGFIPAVSQTSTNGHFLQMFKPELNNIFGSLIYEYKNPAGGELGGMAVGTDK